MRERWRTARRAFIMPTNCLSYMSITSTHYAFTPFTPLAQLWPWPDPSPGRLSHFSHFLTQQASLANKMLAISKQATIGWRQ
jgi:hypothetical protein